MARAVAAVVGVAEQALKPNQNLDRAIWRIAGPLMLANVSTPLLGIVDTAVIGQLPGAHYIGAVAISAQIFSVVYWAFGFIRQGTSGFTAQAFGANNLDEMRAYFLRGLLIAGVAGSAMIILQIPLMWGALQVLAPSDQVAALATEYFHIRIWGAPAALAGYAVLGWLIGTQNTALALAIQVFMNGLNIVLDIVFVLGLDMGVEGVAYATLISEISGAALGCTLIAWRSRSMGGVWRRDLVRDWAAMRHMLGVNRDIFFRTMTMEVVFVSVTAIGSRMGDEVLAANAVLFLFQTFMAFGLDGFADAAEALSGQAYGSRNTQRFKAATRASARWAVLFSIPVCLAYWFAGGAIIDQITVTDSVRALARDYLIWTAILPFVSVWAFLLDGIYFGLTMARAMRNAMLVSLAIYAVSLFFFLEILGNHGLWLSFTIFMAARGVTLGVGYPKLVAMIADGPRHLRA